MNKKYFFFDIDGTLTSTKAPYAVPQSTLAALDALRCNGHFVAIATGRPYYFAEEFARQTGVENMVCNGGNDLYIDGECVLHEPLQHEFAMEIIQDCLQYEIPFCVSCDNTESRITHDESFLQALEGCAFRDDIQVVPNMDYQQLSVIERLFVIIEEGKETTLPSFRKQLPCRYGGKPYVIVDPDDKYQGILKLVDILQGHPEDVVVFGDGVNDIKMFQGAPCSIAMGNAVPQLKEIASYVTKSSDEDGIELALRHFGWID